MCVLRKNQQTFSGRPDRQPFKLAAREYTLRQLRSQYNGTGRQRSAEILSMEMVIGARPAPVLPASKAPSFDLQEAGGAFALATSYGNDSIPYVTRSNTLHDPVF